MLQIFNEARGREKQRLIDVLLCTDCFWEPMNIKVCLHHTIAKAKTMSHDT